MKPVRLAPLHLPENLSSIKLLSLAAEEGVEFAPGSRFFLSRPEGEEYLRLNFATQTPEDIEEGIQRLEVALRRLMAGQHSSQWIDLVLIAYVDSS